jgi:hypothetical protein
VNGNDGELKDDRGVARHQRWYPTFAVRLVVVVVAVVHQDKQYVVGVYPK